MTKAVGYIRVSTEEQTTGYGLAYQANAIRGFAESQGYDLVEIIEEVTSGAKDPQDRVTWECIQSLSEQGVSILIVWRFDRLSRSLYHAINVVYKLKELGISVRSVTEPIDTTNALGETFFALIVGMAAQEREAITRRTWSGRKEKARKGGYACGEIPYGYTRGAHGELMIDPEQAEVVKQIYNMREKGESLRSIAKALNERGILTKYGKRWAGETVRYVLNNAKYRGNLIYCFKLFNKEHISLTNHHQAII